MKLPGSNLLERGRKKPTISLVQPINPASASASQSLICVSISYTMFVLKAFVDAD